MIIGSHQNRLEDIIRDMKSYTSTKLHKMIWEHPQESRREWMLWMMRRAGIKNGNNVDFQFWQQHNHPIELNTNELMDQKLDYIYQCRLLKLHLTLSYGEGWVRRLRKGLSKRHYYIYNNPVVSGFVENPEEWLFSSARDYAGRKGLLEINFIE
jgi:hypothetical protein